MLRTKVILSCDDDVTVSERILDRAYACYVQNNLSGHIFGPFRRGCKRDRYLEQVDPYSFILTGIAFMTVDVLELYHLPRYQAAREQVTRLFNGEDMLMNFVVADSYARRPIYVKFRFAISTAPGISTARPFRGQRQQLCRFFRNLFGDILDLSATDFRYQIK
jgi:hypothetical protein